MKLKNLKNYKTYERLINKRDGGWYKSPHKMPGLRMVSKLLDEIGIDNWLQEWGETKWRENGLRYHTSGGGYYPGWRLRVDDINMDIKSCDTYYSYNTHSYAREIIDLIDKNLKLK